MIMFFPFILLSVFKKYGAEVWSAEVGHVSWIFRLMAVGPVRGNAVWTLVSATYSPNLTPVFNQLFLDVIEYMSDPARRLSRHTTKIRGYYKYGYPFLIGKRLPIL